mmetsp:Transcript_62318/g.197345  ORF Transcript_62318/g.197345 Transcript_62318/m.197345 type:complete len:207 (-) Transcript_62318:1262-1882(-)
MGSPHSHSVGPKGKTSPRLALQKMSMRTSNWFGSLAVTLNSAMPSSTRLTMVSVTLNVMGSLEGTTCISRTVSLLLAPSASSTMMVMVRSWPLRMLSIVFMDVRATERSAARYAPTDAGSLSSRRLLAVALTNMPGSASVMESSSPTISGSIVIMAFAIVGLSTSSSSMPSAKRREAASKVLETTRGPSDVMDNTGGSFTGSKSNA